MQVKIGHILDQFDKDEPTVPSFNKKDLEKAIKALESIDSTVSSIDKIKLDDEDSDNAHDLKYAIEKLGEKCSDTVTLVDFGYEHDQYVDLFQYWKEAAGFFCDMLADVYSEKGLEVVFIETKETGKHQAIKDWCTKTLSDYHYYDYRLYARIYILEPKDAVLFKLKWL